MERAFGPSILFTLIVSDFMTGVHLRRDRGIMKNYSLRVLMACLLLGATQFFMTTRSSAEELHVPQSKTPSLLTEEEKEILKRGRVEGGQRTLGSFVSVFVGFGLGHGAVNLYGDRGWAYTIVDAAIMGGLVLGVMAANAGCPKHSRGEESWCGFGETLTAVSAGVVAILISRIVQVVDLNVVTSSRNEQFDRVKQKEAQAVNLDIFVAPPIAGGPLPTFGVALKF